jgi:hypothetical protein
MDFHAASVRHRVNTSQLVPRGPRQLFTSVDDRTLRRWPCGIRRDIARQTAAVGCRCTRTLPREWLHERARPKIEKGAADRGGHLSRRPRAWGRSRRSPLLPRRLEPQLRAGDQRDRTTQGPRRSTKWKWSSFELVAVSSRTGMLTSPNEIVPLQIGRAAMGASSPAASPRKRPVSRLQVVRIPFTRRTHARG